MAKSRAIAEFGDFQTPLRLAQDVCELLKARGVNPVSIVEPTCGVGHFLRAAAEAFPEARGRGMELNEVYVSAARDRMEDYGGRFTVEVRDFFASDWTQLLAEMPNPILVVGNPPWVTNAELGTMGSDNRPERTNFLGFSGLEALTGKSNFDISEWMLIKLAEALNGKSGQIAMLVKTAVARKLLAYAWRRNLMISSAAILPINAKTHFNAAVDACLLIVEFTPGAFTKYADVFGAFSLTSSHQQIGLKNGELVADLVRYEATQHLVGRSQIQWRSGIKHDCSSVMELSNDEGVLRNGLGETVEIEQTYLYPLLKTSDVARGSAKKDRYVIVTQKRVGEDTVTISQLAPKTWAYLNRHANAFDKRGSSVYKNKHPFSIFGVGDYSFAAWKVAISGLYKHINFTLVAPVAGKPVMVDDATYFIPCRSEAESRYLVLLLNSPLALDFFRSHIFWDAKRPVTTSLLQRLDLYKLADESGLITEADFFDGRQAQFSSV